VLDTSKQLHEMQPQGLPAAPLAARARRPRSSSRRMLQVWDLSMCVVVLAGLAATGTADRASLGLGIAAGLIILLVGPLVISVSGGYERQRHPLGNLPIEFMRLVVASAFAVWMAAVVVELAGGDPKILKLTVVWVAIAAGWLIGRFMAAHRVKRHPERTLLVGTGPVARRVLDLTRRHPEHGVRVVGLVDNFPLMIAPDAPPVLGGTDDLEALLATGEYDRLIIAFSAAVDDLSLSQVLRTCSPRGVRVDVVPRMVDLMGHEARIEALGEMSLVQVGAPTAGPARRVTKRSLDIALAGGGLVVLSPVLAAVAVAVRLDSPGPILFRQTRIGRDSRPFEIAKFRSMTIVHGGDIGEQAGGIIGGALAEVVADLKRDTSRVTKVGAFIRRTSLDELPQLWNVLKGDMSLVGPRPLRPFEVAELERWQNARHEMRPGLTGLWQVLGRSEVGWDERMQMDYSYVRHWSLRQDLRVLARTARVVLGQRGSL
jgi:exopolysaccharide biosynthesis polyprenyl glycosylphosphotransferase